jgi:hypothetical protein
MASYERLGSPPNKLAIMVRWSKVAESAAATRLFDLPLIAPEVIRRVLEDAVENGRFDAIAEEVSSQKG